jgi:hypothetical protein
MICCGVDCGPCTGTICMAMTNGEQNRCPAECNPIVSIDRGLCNDCKSFRPDRLSKKQRRRAKVEERKRERYS